MTYQKGDILKLSEEGLNLLYRWYPARRGRASQRRFEYRCQTRCSPECLTVIRVGTGYYQSYHESFLEKIT